MQKQQELNAPQRWQDSLRALLPSLIINIALSIVIYQVCRAHTSASEIEALLAASAPAAWGLMTLGEFALRVTLIYRLTVLEFLTIDRFLLYGSIALYTGIIWVYGKSNGTFQEEDNPPHPRQTGIRAAH